MNHVSLIKTGLEVIHDTGCVSATKVLEDDGS